VGNCAIKFMPFGGLYIAGGIAKKHLDLIQARSLASPASAVGRRAPPPLPPAVCIASWLRVAFRGCALHSVVARCIPRLHVVSCMLRAPTIALPRHGAWACIRLSSRVVWPERALRRRTAACRAMQDEGSPFMRAYNDRGRVKPLLRKARPAPVPAPALSHTELEPSVPVRRARTSRL
jgi:hypothetical protein